MTKEIQDLPAFMRTLPANVRAAMVAPLHGGEEISTDDLKKLMAIETANFLDAWTDQTRRDAETFARVRTLIPALEAAIEGLIEHPDNQDNIIARATLAKLVDRVGVTDTDKLLFQIDAIAKLRPVIEDLVALRHDVGTMLASLEKTKADMGSAIHDKLRASEHRCATPDDVSRVMRMVATSPANVVQQEISKVLAEIAKA